MPVLLTKSAAAAAGIRRTVGKSGTLSLIGTVTTESVAVEIPTVEEGYNLTDNAHWTPLMVDGEAFVVDASNNARRLPVDLVVRISKAAGVAGNAYGVRWT